MSNKPNTKKNAPRFSLNDFIAEWTAEPFAVFDFNGEEFTIPPMVSWPDRMPRQADAQAKLLLGDQFDRYVELGGTARYFDALLSAVAKRTQGVALGE